MKFCPECGSQWAGSNFCANCGKDLRPYLEISATGTAPASTPVSSSTLLPTAEAFVAWADQQHAIEAEKEQEQQLAPFVTEKLSTGKYLIKKIKNKDELMISVPDCVQMIADEAFSGCGIIEVVLPDGLMKIGRRAFADCVDLETINLPSSLRIIEDEAFSGCENLDVTVPAGIRIGQNAFGGTLLKKKQKAAAKAESILEEQAAQEAAQKEQERQAVAMAAAEKARRAAEAAKQLKIVRANLEDTFNVRELTDGTLAISDCCENPDSFDVPEIVSEIESATFDGCTDLESICIGENVKYIALDAFDGCDSLTDVSICLSQELINSIDSNGQLYDLFPNATCLDLSFASNVTTIPDYFFENMHIDEIAIPNTVKDIGSDAFRNCSALSSIEFDENVKSIAIDAFEDCDALTDVSICLSQELIDSIDSNGRLYDLFPNATCLDLSFASNVTTIPDYFFEDMHIDEISIPDTVKDIGSDAFRNCSALRSIVFDENVKSIAIDAFEDCDALTDVSICLSRELIDSIDSNGRFCDLFPNATCLDISFASNVTIIPYSFFENTLIDEITIPNTVTTIDDYAFSDCGNLESITLGSGVTSIGDSAFACCYSLSTVYLSAGCPLKKRDIIDLFSEDCEIERLG